MTAPGWVIEIAPSEPLYSQPWLSPGSPAMGGASLLVWTVTRLVPAGTPVLFDPGKQPPHGSGPPGVSAATLHPLALELTTPVCTEGAEVEPIAFVAITTTSIVEPTSAALSV